MKYHYGIDVLIRERKLLKDALDSWPKDEYPEAMKDRRRKLRQLDNSLKIIREDVKRMKSRGRRDG